MKIAEFLTAAFAPIFIRFLIERHIKLPSRQRYKAHRGFRISCGLIAAVLSTAVPRGHATEQAPLPQLDHVVVVVLENHSFDQIINPNIAPFIFQLATGGALFVHAFAVSHPSQPNYFVLFSGSTQGITDNRDYTFDVPNLASALTAVGKSFIGYVEAGSPRNHNPWESFISARGMERDFSDFPTDFRRLPTVSFVIPRPDNDMHDGSVRRGDAWLRVHLGPYAAWAKTHNSLLIVTFDEDDNNADNHIATIIYGAEVRPGQYTERISHDNVLSTLQAMYLFPSLTEAAPIRSIWDKVDALQ